MVFHWDEYFSLRILFSIILGIAIYLIFEINFSKLLLCFAFAICIATYFFTKNKISNKAASLFGFVAFVNIAIIANIIAFNNDVKNSIFFYKNEKIENEALVVKIVDAPKETEKSIKLVVQIISAISDSIVTKKEGRAFLYLSKTDLKYKAKFGDKLLVYKPLHEIQGPKNPGEFNYKNYAKHKNIYFSSFLKPNDFTYISSENQAFLNFSFALRKHFIQQLKSKLSPESFSIAAALLIGQKEYLERSLQDVYANTGAMHILAVSGLHVGILFALLSLVFTKLLPKRFVKIGNPIIILILWTYAFVTGLSPSVFRACLMLTLYIIGKSINKKVISTYNIVFVTAILILLFDPNMLASVGFQLSFAAVISIIYFTPKFTEILKPRNWLLSKINDLLCVSVAAQIGTAPLSLYYFNQFPLYFLLTNLFAIFGAFVIFTIGVLFLLVSNINELLSIWVAKLLDLCIFSLNTILKKIEALPFSTLEIYKQEFYVPLLFFVLIISFTFWLLTLKRRAVLIPVFCALILSSSFAINRFIDFNAAKIIFYHNPKQAAVQFIRNNKSHFNVEQENFEESFKNFSLQSSQLQFKCKTQNKTHKQVKNLIQIEDKTIYQIDSTFVFNETPTLKVNYLWLTNSPFIKFDELLLKLEFDSLIIDATNNWKSANYFNKKCSELELPCYNIKSEGALVIDL